MKFLVNAQLPKSLSLLLLEKGYDSIHTLDLPNQSKTNDKSIIAFTELQNRTVVTKDNDFLDSFLIKSQPRKLIMARTGNISNSQRLSLFEGNLNSLLEMLKRSNLIQIGLSEITEHE